MTENEFLLEDRIAKVKQIILQYGKNNFYIAYSGGKDSNVLSWLVDKAIPHNSIPRVYADTGIELKAVKDFVIDKQKHDIRIKIIKPTTPIIKMLKQDGYPFKSKAHSEFLERYQRQGKLKSVMQYLGERHDKEKWSSFKSCPEILKYQFTSDFNLKISDKCCYRLKEEPVKEWSKKYKRPFGIVGILRAEGGRRTTAVCLAFKGKKLDKFQPLVAVSKEWVDWAICEHNIAVPTVYNAPYNFDRTGCKGCPFNKDLQRELDILEQYFPDEKKQCEIIWKPVYDEYRRIGYRLK